MADQDSGDRDDLSEEASPYKLQEMREKGRVAQSREISGLLSLMGAGVTLYFMGSNMGSELSQYMTALLRADLTSALNLSDHSVLMGIFTQLLKTVASVALPIALVAFVFGALGSYIQIGNIFSVEPLKPDPQRIDPIKGFKNKFLSMKQVYDGFRLIIRAVALTAVGYFLVKLEVLESPIYLLKDPSGLLMGHSSAGKTIFLALCGVLLVFAGFDLWLQRWEFSKNVRLTKQEQKQEHKEHEGDPLIRARIRAVQKELARKRMMDSVPTADVVVTNPTHIAVAIKYDRNEMDAPVVVAKGADYIAQKIKKLAAESGVPTVENVPLARALYKSVKLGKVVPRNLYQAVAEVLAFVYKLKNKRGNL